MRHRDLLEQTGGEEGAGLSRFSRTETHRYWLSTAAVDGDDGLVPYLITDS